MLIEAGQAVVNYLGGIGTHVVDGITGTGTWVCGLFMKLIGG